MSTATQNAESRSDNDGWDEIGDRGGDRRLSGEEERTLTLVARLNRAPDLAEQRGCIRQGIDDLAATSNLGLFRCCLRQH